jgi:small-conductance mechanosensitive channel
MVGMDILQINVLNNSFSDYLVFLSFVLAGIVMLRIFVTLILMRVKAWSNKTSTTIDNFLIHLVEKTFIPLSYFYIFYLSLGYLVLPGAIRRGADMLWIIVFTISLLRLLVSIIDYALERYWLKRQGNEANEKSLKGILAVIKVVVWGVGLTFLLDNLGFKVSAVIAGLGIGGIAVALAAQAVLGDLFSYFAIFFDRPFEVGDFIIIGDFLGSVEHVGIKTTRLRSLGGEQIIFSNTDLTNSRVRNYKRMSRRRVVFKFGVVYQTLLENLKKIPGIVSDIIKHNPDADFDRAHFFSFADFSLVFEVVYYVNSPDYNKYMDVQQQINFALKEELEKLGVEFAYPTQTLYLNDQAKSA